MKLHSTVSGSGSEAVVFLHGMAGSSRYWDGVASLLPPAQYKIVQVDLLGFGQSPKPANVDYGYDVHIRYLTETLRQLGVHEFILVGHSMGALLALRLAAARNFKVKKLILAGVPFYETPPEARSAITNGSWLRGKIYFGTSSRLLCNIWCTRLRPLSKRIAPFYLRTLPKQVASDTVLHSWQSYDKSRTNVIEHQHVKHDLGLLNVDTIAVYGSEDGCYPAFRHLLELYPFHRCRIRLVHDAGHQLPLSHPELLAQIIAEK